MGKENRFIAIVNRHLIALIISHGNHMNIYSIQPLG